MLFLFCHPVQYEGSKYLLSGINLGLNNKYDFFFTQVTNSYFLCENYGSTKHLQVNYHASGFVLPVENRRKALQKLCLSKMDLADYMYFE